MKLMLQSVTIPEQQVLISRMLYIYHTTDSLSPVSFVLGCLLLHPLKVTILSSPYCYLSEFFYAYTCDNTIFITTKLFIEPL